MQSEGCWVAGGLEYVARFLESDSLRREVLQEWLRTGRLSSRRLLLHVLHDVLQASVSGCSLGT